MVKSDLPLVVLGLGSNKGDSRKIILDAMDVLKSVLSDLRAASLYETEPLHVTDQKSFINTAVAGFFSGENKLNVPKKAEAEIGLRQEFTLLCLLLHTINRIEAQFGRDRAKERRWGERFLDIDILLFGDFVINEEGLQIPHPRLKERQFALQPLLELLPDAADPITRISYKNICDALGAQGVKKLS